MVNRECVRLITCFTPENVDTSIAERMPAYEYLFWHAHQAAEASLVA